MPAVRLEKEPHPVSLYDVLGQDGNIPCFVRHVGLSNEPVEAIRNGNTVNVAHMKPPLSSDDQMKVHACGIAELTDDECRQIETFITERMSEHQALQQSKTGGYIIRPHAIDRRETDGTLVCRRFSCAGFVIEAYEDANIFLVETDENNLPLMDVDSLRNAYPDIFDSHNWRSLNERYKLGLDGDGPWPVILPGYLFHSLSRTAEDIRQKTYPPRPGDEYFPHQISK